MTQFQNQVNKMLRSDSRYLNSLLGVFYFTSAKGQSAYLAVEPDLGDDD